MINSDAQMAISRDGDPSRNFAVGESTVLCKLIKEAVGDVSAWSGRYPQLYGELQLLDEIAVSQHHIGAHIVVTNGAKQALAAGFTALRMEGMRTARVMTPYWPSFPTLVGASGLKFMPASVPSANVITSPNNPDGAQIPRSWVDLWDAAYASPAYGWNGIVHDCRVAVHTVSKLFGVGGIRVGWLSTQDKTIANHAAMHVECTTSGVSNLSQAYAAGVLRWARENPSDIDNINAAAWRAIQSNAEIVAGILGDYCEQLAVPGIDGRGGMFAWLRPKDCAAFMAATVLAGIKVVVGVSCGMPGWIRFSLGNDAVATVNAVAEIARLLKVK